MNRVTSLSLWQAMSLANDVTSKSVPVQSESPGKIEETHGWKEGKIAQLLFGLIFLPLKK